MPRTSIRWNGWKGWDGDGMGTDERQVAESAIRHQLEEMDAEVRLWVEPMVAELLAA